MESESFVEFFKKAVGREPYPYQVALATATEFPELLVAPTGAGKTAAVLLAWLYRRRWHSDAAVRAGTPRRLIYCLPMRVLVEQTHEVASTILSRLGILEGPDAVDLHLLLGGATESEWRTRPERDAILVGTQDMLLSRALNRGYGESRYLWPFSFGLVNNDCLWTMDEVQLMGAGLATSCQLDAFRRRWGTFGPTHTLWMSATVSSGNLQTVDREPPQRVLDLCDQDRTHEALSRRLQAKKKVARSAVSLTKGKDREYVRSLAKEIVAAHSTERLTLVILNTVTRAQQLYDALRELLAPARGRGRRTQQADEAAPLPELLLIHSRFRPHDRQRLLDRLVSAPGEAGRIVVSTQVVEAGVDLSARVLFTEVAPWPSLVQRFGRCNRGGEFREGAEIRWIDIELANEALARPYEPEALGAARERLLTLTDAAPGSLGPVELESEVTHVPRARDVAQLFDTTADVTGGDLDVSRFIRDTDDRSLQVFWRAIDDRWTGEGKFKRPPRSLERARREELCSVPVGELRDFLKDDRKGKKRTSERLNGWCWDVVDGRWNRVDPDQLRPGLVVLLRADSGGYDPERGWTPTSKDGVGPVPPPAGPESQVAAPEEGADQDGGTYDTDRWVPLSIHLDDAEREARAIGESLDAVFGDADRIPDLLARAARLHDVGKAHPAFQDTLLRRLSSDERSRRERSIWAKSPSTNRSRHHLRPYFRHELASVLAILARPELLAGVPTDKHDLVAYLVAAHHGHVRLAIRSVPGEEAPEHPGVRFARGVHDDDILPEVDLGGGLTLPATQLSLAPMELGLTADGHRSWAERTLQLCDEYGPFRLGFLEALLIAADWRASATPHPPEVENA